MAEQFPLPRSGFKVLRLIVIGYLHVGGRDRKPVGPSSVGAAIGMDTTLVSRNNAFLGAVGLIEGEQRGRWKLTKEGASVAQALEYEAGEELQEALGSVLRENEFIQQVLTFIRSRAGVEEAQLIPHIARTAGVPRKSEFLTGSRAVLELMLAAGIVADDGGLIRTSARRESRAVSSEAGPSADSLGGERRMGGMKTSGETPSQVRVQLNLTAADLKSDAAVDALAARLRRLLGAVSGDVTRTDVD